jgi:hypothetical protein
MVYIIISFYLLCFKGGNKIENIYIYIKARYTLTIKSMFIIWFNLYFKYFIYL